MIVEAADLGVGVEHLESADEPEGAISMGASAGRGAASIEDLRQAVGARGPERGFVTSEELFEGLSMEGLTSEQVEELLAHVGRQASWHGRTWTAVRTRKWRSSLCQLCAVVRDLLRHVNDLERAVGLDEVVDRTGCGEDLW